MKLQELMKWRQVDLYSKLLLLPMTSVDHIQGKLCTDRENSMKDEGKARLKFVFSNEYVIS